MDPISQELQEEAGSAREALLDVGGFWRSRKMYGCFRMVQGGSEGSEGHNVRKPGRCRKVTRKNSIR